MLLINPIVLVKKNKYLKTDLFGLAKSISALRYLE